MKKWKKFAEDHSSLYVHACCYIRGSHYKLEKLIGVPNNTLLLDGKDAHWYYCARTDGEIIEWDELGKIVLKRLEKPAFLMETYDGQEKTAKEVQELSKKIMGMDLAKIENGQLCDLYDSLLDKWEWMNGWGDIVNLADFGHFMLTNKIMAFLEQRAEASNSGISAGEAFGTLGAPIELSFLQQQEIEFFKILEEIQEDKEATLIFSMELEGIITNLHKIPAINSFLLKHVEKYDWINFHYDGPDLADGRFFCDLLRSELKQGTDGKRKKEALLAHGKEIEKQQRDVEKHLNLSSEEKYWCEVARKFSYLKGLRKDSVFIGSRNSDLLIREFAKRLELSPKQVRHATNSEIREWLQKGTADADLLNERIKHNVTICDEKGFRIYVGKEAEKYSKLVVHEEADMNLKELKGTPAYPGLVRGVVKIIGKASDMVKMQQGDILVSMATNPNIVPAMKKAGAIVTDEGGVTCHAAIVSRELKIPCVIGTKIATKWLKDGDEVEVDATKGIIRKLGE
ncbi:MAG: PEP-utilizing enzyme [Candidatus Micrarchaeota archaeon]